jgi:hypothetical protein
MTDKRVTLPEVGDVLMLEVRGVVSEHVVTSVNPNEGTFTAEPRTK